MIIFHSHQLLNSRTGDVFPKGSRFLLVTRSLFAALHNIISYYAMKHLPLPDVTIINATGAVFACVPARMFLEVKNLKHTYTLNLFQMYLLIIIFLIFDQLFTFVGKDNILSCNKYHCKHHWNGSRY